MLVNERYNPSTSQITRKITGPNFSCTPTTTSRCITLKIDQFKSTLSRKQNILKHNIRCKTSILLQSHISYLNQFLLHAKYFGVQSASGSARHHSGIVARDHLIAKVCELTVLSLMMHFFTSFSVEVTLR